MARHPYSSSERRGILAVVAAALLVTGGGMVISRCGGRGPDPDFGRVEVLYSPDTTLWQTPDSLKPQEKDSLRRARKERARSRKDSVKRKGRKPGEKKVYRRRNPLDEGV